MSQDQGEGSGEEREVVSDEDDLIAALKRAREKQVRDAPPDIK